MKHEYKVGKNENGQWFVTRNKTLVIPVNDVIAEYMRDMMGLPIGEEFEADEAYERYCHTNLLNSDVSKVARRHIFKCAYKMGKAAK